MYYIKSIQTQMSNRWMNEKEKQVPDFILCKQFGHNEMAPMTASAKQEQQQ